MKKIFMSIWPVMCFCIAVNAQTNTVEVRVFSQAEKEALIGATIYFEDLNKGVVTNVAGVAPLTQIPNGQHKLIISYLGFETVQALVEIPHKTALVFYLKESSNALDEVVLQSNRSTRIIKKIPTRIEYIGAEELREKAIMNPANISMVLRESTGIQMQQTSLSSGSANIRIQGLNGRYTQLLRDGFPLYGGFSTGLSMVQIPPLDLQQFEIIKGSSSTLYGGGAIAGLVNMISKTPRRRPGLDIMLTQTHALGSTANLFYSKRSDRFGVSLYGSGHYQKAFDPEDDGFSNLPLTKSVSFNPKFFYYPSDKTTFWLGLNGTYDERTGGDITKIENGQGGIHQYTEKNISKRLSTQAVYSTKPNALSSLDIKNSIAFFDRDLSVPGISFGGKQVNTFTEASYRKQGLKSDWTFGANLYTVDFDENDNAALERDQSDITFGLFANSIYDLCESWILETGLRTDYAKAWGFFPLPRVSLLYKTDNGFSTIWK